MYHVRPFCVCDGTKSGPARDTGDRQKGREERDGQEERHEIYTYSRCTSGSEA